VRRGDDLRVLGGLEAHPNHRGYRAVKQEEASCGYEEGLKAVRAAAFPGSSAGKGATFEARP